MKSAQQSIMANSSGPSGTGSPCHSEARRVQIAKAHEDFALRPTSDSFAHLCTSSARLFVDHQETWVSCGQQSLTFQRRGSFEASGRALKAFVEGDSPLTAQLAKWFFAWVHGGGDPQARLGDGASGASMDSRARQFLNCGTLVSAVGFGLAASTCSSTVQGTVDIIDYFIQSFCDGSVTLLLSGVSYTSATVHQLASLLQPPSKLPRKPIARQLIRDVVSGASWPHVSSPNLGHGRTRGIKRSAGTMHFGSSDAGGAASGDRDVLPPPAEAEAADILGHESHDGDPVGAIIAQTVLFPGDLWTDSVSFESPWLSHGALFTAESSGHGAVGTRSDLPAYHDQDLELQVGPGHESSLVVGLALDPHDLMPIVPPVNPATIGGALDELGSTDEPQTFRGAGSGVCVGPSHHGGSGMAARIDSIEAQRIVPTTIMLANASTHGAFAVRSTVPDAPPAHCESGRGYVVTHQSAAPSSGDRHDDRLRIVPAEATPVVLPRAGSVAEPILTRWSLDVKGSSRLIVGSKLGQGTYGVVSVVPWPGLDAHHAIAVCVQKSAITMATGLVAAGSERKSEIPALSRPPVHLRTVLVPPLLASCLRVDTPGFSLAGGRRGAACATLARSRAGTLPVAPTCRVALPVPAASVGHSVSASSLRALSFEREVYVTLKRMGAHPNIVRYLGSGGFPSRDPSCASASGEVPHLLLEACHGMCSSLLSNNQQALCMFLCFVVVTSS